MRWPFDASPEQARRRSDLPHPLPRPWPRLWPLGTAAGLAVPVTLLVVESRGPVVDFLALATALIGLVVLLGAALSITGWAKAVWWSLLAFQVLTMVALATEVATTADGSSPGFPTAADLIALVAYAPALAALGILIRRLYPGRDREAWIDASILTVTLASVVGLFIVTPLIDSAALTDTAKLIAVAFPILDLILISALVWLLVGSSRPTPTLVLISLAMSATLAADLIRDLLLVAPTSAGQGTAMIALRLAALTVFAAAAWTPTAETFVGPATRRSRRTSTPRLAILAIGVLTVPSIVAVRVWQQSADVTLLLALAALIVIILAVWRIQILVSAVERQRRVTELVLDSAGDGIIGLDTAGFVLFANLSARRMLRCREVDLVGQRLHDVAHHEHPDGTPYPWQDCPIHAALTSENVAIVSDQRYIRRDGTAFPVEIVVSPLVIEGDVIGAVQSFRDVSERQHIEEVKRQFVSVVSHELRTPLTSIKGSLQMLESGMLGDLSPDQQDLVAMAVTNSDRLGNLVNDILDLERLDAGRMPLQPSSIRATDLADQALASITGTADAAGVRLERDYSHDAGSVDVDPGRMVQVLTNLLGNAIKFSDRGSTVTVRVRPEGDQVILAICDTGRGIPADRLDTVFERFGQVDVGDARREAGTGLGLAIARDIVQRSGGAIDVSSVLGEGSTFTVTLPAARQAAADEVPA